MNCNNYKDTAVLLLTDKSSSGIVHLYNELKSSLDDCADVMIAYHQKHDEVPVSILLLNHFVFKNDILTNLDYTPIGETLVPGNNHFPLLKFFQQNRKYNNYWIIEDDVRYTGDWKHFFNIANSIEAHFVSCKIRHWVDDPYWGWWSELKHPIKIFPTAKKIASFNPVYRISYDALKFIDHCLKDGWCGHHEVLYPSLLKYGGYSLSDFGGDRNYVVKGFENKVYLEDNKYINGILSDGTMRYRPIMGFVGYHKNKLYHPVKASDEEFNKYNKSFLVREEWVQLMDTLARPVMANLANNRLKELMPVVLSEKIDYAEYRKYSAYLGAFGRTLSGIAPWLNSCSGNAKEQKLRLQYREWGLKAIENAVNPVAKDYLFWEGGQALVDASFFALALIRCSWIWENLNEDVRMKVVNALILTRKTVPVNSNKILSSSMIEAFFCQYGFEYDQLRMEYGIREFMEHWYVGDGMFSDGMNFHLDYYNSIVIQPFLSTILDIITYRTKGYNQYQDKFGKISKRYAEIQERMINSDGSFPVVGRSVTYRTGVFHHLADMALKKRLSAILKPAQVREALTAVIKKTLQASNTIDNKGWLQIGLYGEQSELADFYITTGSLYMCMNVFLPLGLPNSDSFWYSAPEPWSSKKIWNGNNISLDRALDV